MSGKLYLTQNKKYLFYKKYPFFDLDIFEPQFEK